jgi:hypothetical protein
MLTENINLNQSRDISGYSATCTRCDVRKPKDDGVYLGSTQWVCGKCWRLKATRPTGAMAALAAERRGAP